MTPRALNEIEKTLSQLEKFYPQLYMLETTLKELGIDFGEPLPQNGGSLKSIADYGHAVAGLGKFLMIIGHALIELAEGEENE